jgi:hypothetical protein
VFQAGFSDVSMAQVEFPAAIALTAWTADTIAVPPPPEPPAQAVEFPPQEPSPPPIPLENQSSGAAPSIYDQDGLRSFHNHEFMQDPVFQAAYARGVQAVGMDYAWHWRVHTGLWAAHTAFALEGDFAEFGVNKGFLSSAIMQMLDWNSSERKFYLLDTFTGIDTRFISEADIEIGVIERNQRDIDSGFYTFDLDSVKANFAEWPNARVIKGAVPETLAQIDSDRIVFAHIDMNCAPPEVAAIEFLWPRMPNGGIILLDDYAYSGYRSQKLAMDDFAARQGIAILSLPTGQGLICKTDAPPKSSDDRSFAGLRRFFGG